jgi:hypothetical protein
MNKPARAAGKKGIVVQDDDFLVEKLRHSRQDKH